MTPGSQSTPLRESILETRWPVDRALAEVILARSAAGGGLHVSNVGGWHSEPDLPDWPEPPVVNLLERIRMVAGNLGTGRFHAWANVMRNGNYHKAHRHGEAQWTGVYYVDAGDVAGGAIQFARRLETCTIQPQTGLVLLFPGDLLHSVKAYAGEGARISVGFNLF